MKNPRRLLSAVLLYRKAWITALVLSWGIMTFAADPAWWQVRGVLNQTQPTNDFAAVNAGQLKNIAAKARDEMLSSLPGGTSSAIDSLVASLSQVAADSDDFAAVNVGQAKALSKPFYDRLMQAGYCSAYPWSDSDPARNDFAQINVGQVKNLFSFEFTADSNQNGLPDWWETNRFGGLGVSGAGDDPDSDLLTNAEEYWLRTNPGQSADSGAAASAAVGLVVHTDIN